MARVLHIRNTLHKHKYLKNYTLSRLLTFDRTNYRHMSNTDTASLEGHTLLGLGVWSRCEAAVVLLEYQG